MSNKKLSTQPYKGARDFYPEDMRIRNYIFETWKKVCVRYGFEEYDTPLLESWDIYAAKTGEEIVNNQLFSFEDRGGRKVAIRPEKTPSLARLVASKAKELPLPLKWFNIGNCWRYEKPQKGRGREFFQLDCDILGTSSISADAEVFTLPVEMMKEFGATKDMFEIRFNNRRFTEYYLKEIVGISGQLDKPDTQMYLVAKSLDFKTKVSKEDYEQMLTEIGLKQEQKEKLANFVKADLDFVKKYTDKNTGARELIDFNDQVELLGYSEYFKFSPEIMRGLDYYTGTVIEMFDLNPENNRSMFGGGRYDNLVELYTNNKIPGVGFAMGDITLLEFLNNWNLLPTLQNQTEYLVTLWPDDTKDKKFFKKTLKIAQKLRNDGKNVQTWLEPDTKLDKQLKYADKKGIKSVIIIGPKELEEKKVTIKDLSTQEQETVTI